MSSGEKLAKGKSKKAAPKAKAAKGKEVPINDHRFRGDGVKFKCKLIGSADVSSARGDTMCAEAIKKLKVNAVKLNKESGEHKQKIVLIVTLKGIRIIDEKSQKAQHEHPINKISFITHDPEDRKIFGYVCSQPCSTGHKLFAIKSEKPAGVVTGTLYELFQVVFQLRQQAGLTKKVPNSAQVSNGPSPQGSDGIYEVPYKNGNNKNTAASPQDQHYAEPDQHYAEPVTPTSKQDLHYKVPKNQPVQAALPPLPGENNKDSEVGEKTTQAHFSNSSNLLSPSSMDKDPDQVSQASVEVPFTTQDSSSADMAFFSPSVFESAPGESGAADTVSVASADMSVIRSGSVSSGSSETHSQDTRSGHSRSSSLLNQTAATEGFQAEFATAFDDNNTVGSPFGGKAKQEDEQASENGNQGDISTAFPPQSDANMESRFKAPPVSETSTGFESSSDPFASSDVATSVEERTDPGTGESFFTTSFATSFDASFSDLEVKGDENNKRKDEPLDDPFAPSIDSQAKANNFESAEGFVSETSFETAFGSEQFSPPKDISTQEKDHTQEGSEDAKTVEAEGLPQSVENPAVSFAWDNTFEETKAESQPEATQSVAVTSESQFSWTESFTSEDIETPAAGPKSSASVSWDDAFGTVSTDKESTSQGPDAFSWDDAFGEMAGDSNNLQFDSSAFGDAFAPTSAVESSNEVSGVSKHGAQSVSQSTEPSNPQLNDMPSVPEEKSKTADDPQLLDDGAFTTLSSSQFEESTTDAQNTDVSPDLPSVSKDPFEELTVSFPVPSSASGNIDLEETKESSESVVRNANEDIEFAKELSGALPSGEHSKETKPKEMEEILTHSEEQSPISDAVDERKPEENSDIAPSELVIQDSKPTFSERPISPTVPPPLPPRPVAAAPPLPARPSSLSSTISTGMSPAGSQISTGSPSSNSPHQGKKGSSKKPPPALPPRVDLNENSANTSSDETVAFPDPFGVDFFDPKFDNSKGVAEDGNSDWAASWPNLQKTSTEEKTKDFSDPFSDNFFTNFDFPQKSASDNSKSDNLDPFAATNPPSELFPSTFGNQDLFAAFTPEKGNDAFGSGDPFKNDLSDSFAAFSSDDPFSDISDPFADKGVLSDDPFGDSPRKPQAGKALTLKESLEASDEADSFA